MYNSNTFIISRNFYHYTLDNYTLFIRCNQHSIQAIVITTHSFITVKSDDARTGFSENLDCVLQWRTGVTKKSYTKSGQNESQLYATSDSICTTLQRMKTLSQQIVIFLAM